MSLNTLWFIFIAILYTGFFVLEGFDFGVGILLPFLGKNDVQRRTIINSIGPHWDGNEVWLIVAGGATFAAFPNWYATLFSGFYLPLFLVLVSLIIRGVAFEYRSKHDDPKWRNLWDWCIFTGSLLPTILLPIAFANILRGVPIDANMQYVGGFFNLLNPYALLAALVVTLLFTLHGASFLSIKTTGEVEQGAKKYIRWLWLLVSILLVIFMITTAIITNLLDRINFLTILIPVISLAAILAAGYFLRKQQFGRGIFNDLSDGRLFGTHNFRPAISECDGFKFKSRLEPEYSKCIVYPIYFKNHDHCYPDIPAYHTDLPGMDVLDFP